jgi:hypothetical protein
MFPMTASKSSYPSRRKQTELGSAMLRNSVSGGTIRPSMFCWLIAVKAVSRLDHPEREFQTRPDRARLELQQSGIPSVVIRAVDYLD